MTQSRRWLNVTVPRTFNAPAVLVVVVLMSLTFSMVIPAGVSFGASLVAETGGSREGQSLAAKAPGRLTVIIRGARPQQYTMVKIQQLQPKKSKVYVDLIKRREGFRVRPGVYRVSLGTPSLPARITTGTRPTQAKPVVVRVKSGQSVKAPLRVVVPKAGPFTPFNQVVAGTQFTCALDNRGAAWCWGRDDSGQGGNGYDGRENRTVFGDIPDAFLTRPTRVAGSHSFTQIAAGGFNACGLDLGGRAWCWGTNAEGQLGVGNKQPRIAYEPIAVTGNHVFEQISVGMFHTCALDTEGQAWCWGRNVFGEAGVQGGNGVDAVLTPTPIQQPGRFTQLALGEVHSCALDAAGAAWCWGWGGEGQLGTGRPEKGTRLPLMVTGGRAFVDLAVSSRSSCGLDDARRAWCWGQNTKGTVGSAARADQLNSPVQVIGNLRLDAVSGFGETFVARDVAGAWWFWGESPHGYSPRGSKPPKASSPRKLVVPEETVAFGGDFRGNCALQSDGAAICHTDE